MDPNGPLARLFALVGAWGSFPMGVAIVGSAWGPLTSLWGLFFAMMGTFVLWSWLGFRGAFPSQAERREWQLANLIGGMFMLLIFVGYILR
jgi:predicted permease